MSAAYWLAFALASIPYFAYLVGMTLSGLAFGRVNRPVPQGRRLPGQMLVLSALAAFSFAVWQQNRVAFFFDPLPPLTGDFEEIESREVFGVTIPLELGSTMNSFVNSAFFSLLMTGLVVSTIVSAFRYRSLPRSERPLPNWAGYVFGIGFAALLVWSGRYYFVSAVRDWQILF